MVSHLKKFRGFLGLVGFPNSKVLIILWKGGLSSLFNVLLNFGLPLRIHDDLWRLESGCSDKLKVRVSDELPETNQCQIKTSIQLYSFKSILFNVVPGQPEEWFLEVVVAFG